MKLQSNPPNAASEPIPHSSPLQAPLASMSIKDQNTAYSDALPSDQRRGEVTAANDLIPPTSGMERGQDGSAGGLFFLDDVGSSLPSRNKLSPPQVPRRRPSSLSDSSEEVIVFEGRRHARVDNLGGRKPTAQKPSTNNPGDSHSPQANGRLNRGVVDTVQSPSTRLAIHYEPQQSGRSIYNTLDSTYPKTDFNKQAKGQPTERIGLSRSSRRRNQRRSKGKTFLAAEEDEILADYIEHMNDEEDHDITLGNVANPEGLIQDLLADLGSPADTDSDAEEVAAGSPPTGNLRRDSYVAQSTDDDDDDDDNFDFDASTDEESDESIDEALIAADVQEYMDDIEDERDLLERKQARMTDEQIARLLSKQEEFGIDSSQLLLFDGDDPNVSSEEDDDAMVFRSAAAKRRRRAKRKAQNNPTGASFAAMELTNIFDQDPYGDFDVMDHNRPSLKRTPKSRRSAPAFELSDVELQASLQLAWEKDRSKKKIKKKEREELRAQGLLGRDNGHADLKMKYREGISFGEIKNELVEFFVSERQRYVWFLS